MPYNEQTNRIEKTDTHGISLYDIAKGLRDDRVNAKGQRDLGMLCTSPQIRKWSKHKPFVVRGDNDHPYGVQTEDDRRDAAYGFYWWNYVLENEAPFANSASACLDKAIANKGDWAYKKPTNIFRVQDFDGYLRTAEPPYRVDINSPDLGQNNYIRAVHDPNDANIEITLSDMPDFSGDYSGSCADMNIVYLWRMKNTTTMIVHFTGLKVSDIDNQTTAGAEAVHINMGQLGSYTRKEYDFCVAATTASSADDDGAWVYLPNSLKTIVFKEGVVWVYSDVFNGETFNGFLINPISGAYDSNDVQDIAIGFTIKNEFDNAIDYNLSILMWNDGEGELINDAWEIYSDVGQIAKGGAMVEDLTLEIPADVNGPHTADGLKIAINFDYKNVANTDYIHRHMNLLTERFETYEAEDGYTLAEIRANIPNYANPIIF
jgi:hypothetical protein